MSCNFFVNVYVILNKLLIIYTYKRVCIYIFKWDKNKMNIMKILNECEGIIMDENYCFFYYDN